MPIDLPPDERESRKKELDNAILAAIRNTYGCVDNLAWGCMTVAWRRGQ